MTCDAMTIWARRYAKLATEMAAKEMNAQRKKELLEIAEICEWVPENPARNFREALQAQWWGQMFTRIEHTRAPWARADGSVPAAVLPQGYRRGPDHRRVGQGAPPLHVDEYVQASRSN